MSEGSGVTTREWLDPPGPIRRYRRMVGVLVLVSVVLTAALWVFVTDAVQPFLTGMVVIAILGVCYLVIWAINLVAFVTDPDESVW